MVLIAGAASMDVFNIISPPAGGIGLYPVPDVTKTGTVTLTVGGGTITRNEFVTKTSTLTNECVATRTLVSTLTQTRPVDDTVVITFRDHQPQVETVTTTTTSSKVCTDTVTNFKCDSITATRKRTITHWSQNLLPTTVTIKSDVTETYPRYFLKTVIVTVPVTKTMTLIETDTIYRTPTTSIGRALPEAVTQGY